MGNTATVVGFRLYAVLKKLRRLGENDTFDEKGEIMGYLVVKDIVSLPSKQPLSWAHEQTPTPAPNPQPIQPGPSNSGPISDPPSARQQSSVPGSNDAQPAIKPSNSGPNNLCRRYSSQILTGLINPGRNRNRNGNV